MFVLLTILIVLCAILLVLLVLVQNSKGGGLASGFAGGNQVMGAPKTADLLEKATWTLAGLIVLLSIFAVGVHSTHETAIAEAPLSVEVAEPAASAAEAPAAEMPVELPAQGE